MILHKDRKSFEEIIIQTANYYNIDKPEPNSLIDLRVRLFLIFEKNCLKMLNNTAYVNDFSQSIY